MLPKSKQKKAEPLDKQGIRLSLLRPRLFVLFYFSIKAALFASKIIVLSFQKR